MSPVTRGGRQSRITDSLAKSMTALGELPQTNNAGYAITFTAYVSDKIFNMAGGSLQVFTIPHDAYYDLYFDVNHPDYPAVGFGHGWSGTGEGSAWIQSSRYGQLARQNWGPIADDSQNHVLTCNMPHQYHARGDTIQFWTRGTATGTGVIPWNAHASITRRRA